MARLKLCTLLCVIPASLFAQPAGHGVISGTVVEAGSGDAVRKAVVTATWHGTPRAWATARTDGSGRFTFEGLPAGNYDLRAVKQGLGTAIYGANSIRELGDLITLGDGETRANLKLLFLHSGSISGRVVDTDGDPVPGAGVTLLQSGHNLDARVLTNYQGTNSNDRGEYRFTGVDPGEYYLKCVPNVQQQMGLGQPIVVPQYFGGAHASKDAAPVTLRGGDALSGIDFRLIAERPATISGRVTGVPQIDPPVDPSAPGPGVTGSSIENGRRIFHGRVQMVNIQFFSADDDNQMFGGMGGAAAPGPDYSFTLRESVPGRYRVQANFQANGRFYYASQLIDAHEGPNEIVLTMVPGVDVKGHLKIEGHAEGPVENFTIALTSPGIGPRGGSYSPVKKDGSFTMENVSPGEWILNINPNAEGMFEKSVLLGDKDFLYKQIEIPAGSDAPLNVVLSSNTATIAGEIEAEQGSAVKRAGILLEPVGARHALTRFYHTATATMPASSR
jgi:protocatechuate 3,4-dioxygenase beta subunit